MRAFLVVFLVFGSVYGQDDAATVNDTLVINDGDSATVDSRQMPTMGAPVINDVNIECGPDRMEIIVETEGPFGGKIYPKGFYKREECVVSFDNAESPVSMNLTFDQVDACGMNLESNDDSAEFTSVVVVQPHSKLVTMMARAFQVRCAYDYRGARLSGDGFSGIVQDNLNVSMLGTVWEEDADGLSLRLLDDGVSAVDATAPPPTANMTIYLADSDVDASQVNLGDLLEMRVSIGTSKDTYGIFVRSCVVDDGMGMDSQQLLDQDGCAVASNLFPSFSYDRNMTTAIALFKAHKFPYTSQVQYVCYVDFCMRVNGGCREFAQRAETLAAGACPRQTREGRIINSDPSEAIESLSETNIHNDGAERRRREFKLHEYLKEHLSRSKRQITSYTPFSTLPLKQAIMVVDPDELTVPRAEEESAPLISSLTNVRGIRTQQCENIAEEAFVNSSTMFIISIVLMVTVLVLASLLIFVLFRTSYNRY